MIINIKLVKFINQYFSNFIMLIDTDDKTENLINDV